ncbi:unnamed protein product, partial [Closterium sp. NIES-54]
SGVAIFDLDFDAILAAMYAVSISVEGDCYVCVPPDHGIEAAALGASESAAPGAGESALSGTASAQVFHTFTLDSGASRSFFRDRTTLTALSRPVAVSLADPSGGTVLARYSTVLPCTAALSGSLSGLYLPSFSTNLVSGANLQDAGVDQFTPAGQRVTHCSCAQTGRHLATFTRRPGSSLYTLTTESPPVAASGQVAASSQVFAAASRSGMASHVLVSGLPRSLPPLPPGPAPTCVPYVEGRQRAAPHSSEFPPTEAPLQTLHMDMWGPARVRGQGHERYFLLVVDDYSRYTTLFPLCSKGEVTEVLIDWIRAARLQLRECFGSDFPVLRLHSDRGREFSSDLLRAFCRAEGIRQTFTLPASPQQNGIAERRIGMVMDVARTSMIHAAAPHFLWPFAVQYAARQINLQPRVSLPETSPTLRWTGKVGDASAFRVWGSRAFVRDLSADKLSSRAVPCVFLGFPPDAPGWQFYHPTSRRVLSSQDVTFDESVPYYRLFPYRTAPLPPPPLFLAPGPPSVDPLPPQGPAPSGVSQVDAVDGGRSGPPRGGPGGGRGQQQQRRSGTQTPQQLREWLVQRGAGEGSQTCPYVIRTGARAGRTCGRFHTERRCFALLDDAWRTEFGDDIERPHWAELLRSGVAIFDLDLDVIISAMYALSFTAEGDCYRGVPPDPGIAAAALGASASGTPLAQLSLLFLLMFRSDWLTPLGARSLAVPPLSSRVRRKPPLARVASCRIRLFFGTTAWVTPLMPHLRGMHSRLLVSGLPRSLPPLPPSPAPPCLPCVEGRQRAAPHSSSFPPTTAPLQTLHMDVWGPARVSGQGRERYFLLVVDDYTRYTTVFPLRSKGEVSAVLIPWIHTVRLQLRERFGQDLPVLRLHSDRGVMEVARTSMIHAAAPHFLWPFAVWYAAHQLNLWPRVSLPETSPTLRWTGKVGDASVFRVWGSHAFVRYTFADKLSARAIPC